MKRKQTFGEKMLKISDSMRRTGEMLSQGITMPLLLAEKTVKPRLGLSNNIDDLRQAIVDFDADGNRKAKVRRRKVK